MKRILFIAMALLSIVSFYSCTKVRGKGPVVTETRVTSQFTGISFDLPANLHYTPGQVFKVEIRAQQNIIDVVETYVSGNDLKIKLRTGTIISSHDNVEVYVQAPDVTSLSLGGSGYINVEQLYRPTDVKFRLSGSGRILVSQLETNSIDADISGSGSLQVNAGKSNTEDISISGSGLADLVNLITEEAVTQTSGSGTIQLQVNKKLKSRISGSGVVMYKGNPSVDVSVSGSGRVVKL